MRVIAERDVCIGAENCRNYAPHTFETDADGKVVVTADGADPDAAVATAVSACPVGALRIADTEEAETA